MSGPPEISVIVPVYNVQDHVAACIASLRAQTWTDFEAIVVDDGATDDSPARLRAAIGDDARFRVITQENRGLSGARNTGLDHARGHFIAFLDSDDRFAPAFLYRLREEMLATGADWAACAVRLEWPDGSSGIHSAVHGAPDTSAMPRTHLWPLDDWRVAIRHFPSAWNKLYRRSLIDELRYDEGTYFEDHAFYYRAAARAGALLHVAEPLYIHARERPGQITGEDSDRVFEQIDVLETVAPLLLDPCKSHGRDALERLASRLLFERSETLRDPDRRARFAQAGAAFLDRHGVQWNDAWDPNISPAWGMEMAGHCPMTVAVCWTGTGDAMQATLTSLATQHLAGFEARVAVPSARVARQCRAMAGDLGLPVQTHIIRRPGFAAKRNALLDAARGVLFVPVNAGDVFEPAALQRWCNVMVRQTADMGVSAAYLLTSDRPTSGFGQPRQRLTDLPRETGWALSGRQVRALDAHPSGKVFRTAHLHAHSLRFGGTRNDEQQLVRRAADLATRVVWMPDRWVQVLDEGALRAVVNRFGPRPGSPIRRYAGAFLRRLPAVRARLVGMVR